MIRCLPILFLVAACSPAFGAVEADRLLKQGFLVQEGFEQAPGFTTQDAAGNRVDSSSFRGKLVLLNFWATWCPPCVEEMPSLQLLQDSLGDDGLKVVAVSVDERYSDIPPFVAEHGLRFLVLHDLGKRVSRRYEVFQFPETWIIRRDGTLASHIIGARDWAAPGSLEIFRDLLE
jgi:peroxiredoxin